MDASCFIAGLTLLLGSACQSHKSWDMEPFLRHSPSSILVLPPVDATLELDGSSMVLASITQPLAEQGYYVFPVALVQSMLLENGLPTPDDMHSVSLENLQEVFDPDAVLYLTIEEWGTDYHAITSRTQVAVSGRLLDAGTGEVLWKGRAQRSQSSGGAGGGWFGALAVALATQVLSTKGEASRELAAGVCHDLIRSRRDGLLEGPYRSE